MQPTLTLCRTQEAYQRSLAAAATLDNVRFKANAAANAWAKEGAAAQIRETRKAKAAASGEQVILYGEPHEDDDATLSENPDRGFVTV
jgi:hypothetical protein